MTLKHKILVLVFTALSFVGCKAGESAPVSGATAVQSGRSCPNYGGLSTMCMDLTGSSFADSYVASAVCGSGTLDNLAYCHQTAQRVGNCSVHAASASEMVMRFYAPMTLAQAQSVCSLNGGVFVPN